jgi:hypothetical protein
MIIYSGTLHADVHDPGFSKKVGTEPGRTLTPWTQGPGLRVVLKDRCDVT